MQKKLLYSHQELVLKSGLEIVFQIQRHVWDVL